MKQLNLSQAKLLSELVIPVQVSLGELSLTASQLLDLNTGEHFPLSIEENSPISLIVSGETIAKGRLVSDGSLIYILITEIQHETSEPICPIEERADHMED